MNKFKKQIYKIMPPLIGQGKASEWLDLSQTVACVQMLESINIIAVYFADVVS